MSVESVSTEQLKRYIDNLLGRFGLTETEFLELGSEGELSDAELDFAYNAIWPLLKETTAA